MKILNGHPYLLICGPGTNFWIGKEVWLGQVRIFLNSEIFFLWVFILHMANKSSFHELSNVIRDDYI